MAIDWYPFFVIDYRRDTYHLTLEEDAAYRRLIDEYMVTREALPGNDEALARIVGIPKTEWTRLAPKVRRFFKARNDKLWHKRCEMELRAQQSRHNRRSAVAKKAATAKALKAKNLAANGLLEVCLNMPHYKRKKEDLSTEIVDGQPVETCGQLARKRPTEEVIEDIRSRKKRGHA